MFELGVGLNVAGGCDFFFTLFVRKYLRGRNQMYEMRWKTSTDIFQEHLANILFHSADNSISEFWHSI